MITHEKRMRVEIPASGWTVVITSTRGSAAVEIGLHWGDKIEPTHVFTVPKEELCALLGESSS